MPPIRMPPIRSARRLAWSNSKWRVYADDLDDGAGTVVHGYLVLESTAVGPHLVTGVAVLPEIGGRIALLHNHRHPLGGRSWEMVKGFIDQGETPAVAALRELAEETGLVCDPADLVPLGSFLPEGATMAARGLLFLARNCRPAAAGHGAEAGTEVEIGLGDRTLFDLETVGRMAADSEIEDAATLIGFYRALPRLSDAGRTSDATAPGTDGPSGAP